MPRRVFITVAEVSGDLHAAELIRSLRLLDPEIQIEGFGGPQMAAAGANILHETTTGAAMTQHGIFRAVEVWKLLKQAKQIYQDRKPDLQICVDSSAMNLHFAKAAKEAGVPVFYYIAPQLWASREGRMKKVQAYVDRLACILPFEEEYFRKHGVNATFVGHPLFDELPPNRSTVPPDHPPEGPVIGIIPGSRKSKANLPHLLDVAKKIRIVFPRARFLVPTTPGANDYVADTIDNEPGLGSSRGTFTVEQNAFDKFIPQCDLCITKSGTSTLHVAAWNVPMIVVYRINPILWNLVGRWVVKTKKIALVNILAGQKELVPEFIPWYGSNDSVADCAIDLLKHPAKLDAQRAKLAGLIKSIEKPGASMNAARLAMELIQPAAANRPLL
jgi:lipid-A-disaccharide synthase